MLPKHPTLYATLIVCLVIAGCQAAPKCTPLKDSTTGADCTNIGTQHATCTSKERGKFDVYNAPGQCKWVCGTHLQCVAPFVDVNKPKCPEGQRLDANGVCRLNKTG